MQAARGTSLSDDTHDPAPARVIPSRYRWLVAVVAVTAYAVDLASKQLAVTRLDDGDVPVLGDWFVLHLTRNPGAAFSTGTSYTILLTCIAIAAAVAVLWVARRLGSVGWAAGLGFLLAGILGNLTDRIFREPGVMQGHVVDFLRLPNFPVFNVADICINIAAGVIIVQALRGMSVAGTRHGGDRRDPEAPGQ
jgi:signal peptidase II